jgi:hypothetical protein
VQPVRHHGESPDVALPVDRLQVVFAGFGQPERDKHAARCPGPGDRVGWPFGVVGQPHPPLVRDQQRHGQPQPHLHRAVAGHGRDHPGNDRDEPHRPAVLARVPVLLVVPLGAQHRGGHLGLEEKEREPDEDRRQVQFLRGDLPHRLHAPAEPDQQRQRGQPFVGASALDRPADRPCQQQHRCPESGDNQQFMVVPTPADEVAHRFQRFAHWSFLQVIRRLLVHVSR